MSQKQKDPKSTRQQQNQAATLEANVATANLETSTKMESTAIQDMRTIIPEV